MDGSKENAFQLTSYHIGIYTYSKKPKFFMYSAGEPKQESLGFVALFFVQWHRMDALASGLN